MKSELEKFIETETPTDFKNHLIFIYQLFLMESNFNKIQGSKMSVFPILLQYMAIGLSSKNPKIKNFMELFHIIINKPIK